VLLTALEYMHSLKVIHGDIKPENVLVNADCRVKVRNCTTFYLTQYNIHPWQCVYIIFVKVSFISLAIVSLSLLSADAP